MAKEVHKLQQLSAGDENPHIQELRKNGAELATAHNNLVEAFNKNFSIWNGVIANLDVRLGALTLLGEELQIRAGLPPMAHYVLKYQEQVAAEHARITEAQANLGQQAGEFQAAATLVAQDPLITPPEVEDPAEEDDAVDSDFGGDLEHAQA